MNPLLSQEKLYPFTKVSVLGIMDTFRFFSEYWVLIQLLLILRGPKSQGGPAVTEMR